MQATAPVSVIRTKSDTSLESLRQASPSTLRPPLLHSDSAASLPTNHPPLLRSGSLVRPYATMAAPYFSWCCQGQRLVDPPGQELDIQAT
jgi:hypothetical protein